MTSVSIRAMTSEDIPILADWMPKIPLWQRYHLTSNLIHHQFQVALEKADLLLVADLAPGDRACGFTWCLRHGGFGLSAYLRLIGVRQDLGGTGIGSSLLAETEKLAAAEASSMLLLVSDFNQAAQRFYQRHGYRQVGALPGYVLPDVSELVFWKRFDQTSRSG